MKGTALNIFRLIMFIGITAVVSGFAFCEKSSADVILNTLRPNIQYYPSIAKLGNGNYAASWFLDVFYRGGPYYHIFTGDLTPIGDYDLRISSQWNLATGTAILAVMDDTSYVAAFNRRSQNDTSDFNVYMRRFDNYGNALSQDILVNSDTALDQHIANIICDTAGGIIITWWTVIDSSFDIRYYYYKRFDNNLNALTDDIVIYNGDEHIELLTLAAISEDKLMAVWNREYDIVGSMEVIGKAFEIDGTNPIGPFTVNTTQGGDFFEPYILSMNNNGALVIWSECDEPFETAICGRRYNANAEPIDNDDLVLSSPDSIRDGYYLLQVNPTALYDTISLKITICWMQDNGYYEGVFDIDARSFNNNLEPITDVYRINDMNIACEHQNITYAGVDSIMVVWDGYIDDYYQTDIIGNIKQIPNIEAIKDNPNPEFMSKINACPNPFNSIATIEFTLQRSADVRIAIFDILGRKIEQVIQERRPSGINKVRWNSEGVSSGIYFCKIETPDYQNTIRVTLLK